MPRDLGSRLSRLERNMIGGRELAILHGVYLQPPTTWGDLLARVAVEGRRLVEDIDNSEGV